MSLTRGLGAGFAQRFEGERRLGHRFAHPGYLLRRRGFAGSWARIGPAAPTAAHIIEELVARLVDYHGLGRGAVAALTQNHNRLPLADHAGGRRQLPLDGVKSTGHSGNWSLTGGAQGDEVFRSPRS